MNDLVSESLPNSMRTLVAPTVLAAPLLTTATGEPTVTLANVGAVTPRSCS